MARTAADQFIAGKPVVYLGFDGNLYTAIFATGERGEALGVPSLTVKDARGKVIRDLIMSESKARGFFMSLDREAA